jgi:hypothetical protein
MASRGSSRLRSQLTSLRTSALAVSGAPLAQTPDWLSAVEQFGEGFFLKLAPEAIAHWLSRPGFGSDFDGAKVPAGVGNAAGLQNLVQVMRTHDYGELLIEKLCHRNWLRVLGQTWGKAHTP